MTETQHQIIIGGLLGDGSIADESGSGRQPRYTEYHTYRQGEYIFWKKVKLEDLGAKMKPLVRENKTVGHCRCGYYLWTRREAMWKEYRKLAYRNGKKTLSWELLREAEAPAVAIWLCDDGWWKKDRHTIVFGTHRYSHEEHKIAQKWFADKWDIYPTIVHNKHLCCLAFPRRETDKLLAVIGPFIPVESMEYKIGKPVKEICPIVA